MVNGKVTGRHCFKILLIFYFKYNASREHYYTCSVKNDVQIFGQPSPYKTWIINRDGLKKQKQTKDQINTKGKVSSKYSDFQRLGPVCELRQNKWLSHRQPSFNFWLCDKMFGCPSFFFKGEFWLQIYGCPPDNGIIGFGYPAFFFLIFIYLFIFLVTSKRTTVISHAGWVFSKKSPEF